VILSFDQLTYTYPGAPHAAVRDVTLEVAPGEFVVVAGASGSGKSTLLRAASGLVPHFYGGELAGRVTVAGMDTREHGPGQLARVVGTLFQDPETQVVMGTVRAELGFGLENQGEPPQVVARAVEEVALALGIAQLLDRSTSELSGGELQRVALGAALAGRPSLVVLDEPTSQLDPVAGDELIGLLRRLNEDHDTTVVLSEHRLERCLPAATRVLALVDGEVVCDATPTEFLAWAGGAVPAMQTPGARLLEQLGLVPVAGVKAARGALRAAGVDLEQLPAQPAVSPPPRQPYLKLSSITKRDAPAALALRHVWHELKGGATILRDLSLELQPGELVALMGRNGAGKSTLLRHAGGLMKPTRGKVECAGRVALLLQNPADYLIHDRVDQETSKAALARVGLDPDRYGARHPRDLSGGEKQLLALAIVLGDGAEIVAPVAVLLDEPTRGMDRTRKGDLAQLLRGLGVAVVVATHDPEFAAAFAERVVLLADGGVIADGPVAEVLTGGSYFATETARILGGAGGALTAQQGAALIKQSLEARTEVEL
jgi:energy-coupling factor transport system ATP-binding protein